MRDNRVPTSPVTGGSPTSPYPPFDHADAPAPISFPPPPNPSAPPLSGSPSSVGSRTGSNALTRALNAASKKLFGSSNSLRSSPYYREYTTTSPRRQQIIASRGGLGQGLDVDGAKDPLEDALLEGLEELAQKTDVLTRWGDEMYEYVKAVPLSTSTSRSTQTTGIDIDTEPLRDPSKFERLEGETEKLAQRRRHAAEVQWTGDEDDGLRDDGNLEVHDGVPLGVVQATAGLSATTKRWRKRGTRRCAAWGRSGDGRAFGDNEEVEGETHSTDNANVRHALP